MTAAPTALADFLGYVDPGLPPLGSRLATGPPALTFALVSSAMVILKVGAIESGIETALAEDLERSRLRGLEGRWLNVSPVAGALG